MSGHSNNVIVSAALCADLSDRTCFFSSDTSATTGVGPSPRELLSIVLLFFEAAESSVKLAGLDVRDLLGARGPRRGFSGSSFAG